MAHKRFRTIEGETAGETIAKLEPWLPSDATIDDDFEGNIIVRILGAPYPTVHRVVGNALRNAYGSEVAAATLGLD